MEIEWTLLHKALYCLALYCYWLINFIFKLGYCKVIVFKLKSYTGLNEK